MLLNEQIKKESMENYFKGKESKRKGLNGITLSQQNSQLLNKNSNGSAFHNRIMYKSDIKLKTQQQVTEVQIQTNIKMSQDFHLVSLQFQYQSLHYIPSIIQKKKEQNSQAMQNLKQRIKIQKNNKNLNQYSLKSIQRIYLYTNYLKSFEKIDFCSLINLKQLNLDQNLITIIPAQELNKLPTLEILKLNCNQIEIVPYLKYVICLQLIQNPIKLITDKLQVMPIQTLEIDWTDYIFPDLIKFNINNNKQTKPLKSITDFNNNKDDESQQQSQSAVACLKKAITKIKNNQDYLLKTKNKSYLEFKDLFQFQQIKQKQLQQKVALLLFKAIKDQHFFFITYLRQNCSNLLYNKMNVYNKYLIDSALSSKSNQILSLFCPKIWPYPKEHAQPFFTNILSGIKYHHNQFVKYLLQVNPSYNFNKENEKIILTQIMSNFQQKNQKDKEILKILLQKFQLNNSQKLHSQIVFDLNKLPFSKSTQISDFVLYILSNPQFKTKIQFTETQEYCSNSLLHFALKAKHLSLTLFCLKNLKLNVFKRNKTGQLPRCMQGTDILSKKILWKRQKSEMRILYKQSQNKQRKYEKLMKINESFRSNCNENINKYKQLKKNKEQKYINLLQELKKQLLKIFYDNTQQVQKVFYESFQQNFMQTEQQIIFIVNNIIQSKSLVVGKREINLILNILNKVQSYDKRSYIYDQLTKSVLKYDSKKNKLLNGISSIATQCNDNENQFQFQLCQATLAFTQPYAFYFEKLSLPPKDTQIKQYVCGIDVSKIGCKKCD